LDLIAAAAREFPDYSFVLIGPLRNNIGQLFSCKNIFYLESVPYEKVPEYIRAMDVCMLPFRPTESVLNADSLKVLQYFSLGKPVVSTIRLPIKEYADLVWIGSDTRRFSEAIRCALRESHGMAEQRIKIAKNRSWLLICEKALSRLTKAT